MTRYKVEVTMTDGNVYILTRTVKNPNEAGGLVEQAAKQGEFLAASDINGPAYVNARYVVALCYYETGAE